jgi:hypothetical protein
MVRVTEPTEYKAAARSFRAPHAGSPPIVHPDTPKPAVVLEAVKAEPLGGRQRRPALMAPARAGLYFVLGRGEETGARKSNKETCDEIR